MNRIEPYYMDVYFDNENMWYFDNGNQVLCRRKIANGIVDLIIPYLGNIPFRASYVFCYESTLYITSFYSSNMLKYSFGEDALELVENASEKLFDEIYYNFYDFQMLVDDKIWFFPNYCIKPIYFYDLTGKAYYEDDLLMKYISKYTSKEDMAMVFTNGFETKYWMALANSNIYVSYDLRKREIKEYRIENEDVRLNAICFDGNNAWLTQSNKDKVLRMNIKDMKITELSCLQGVGGQEYARIENTKDYIVVLPRLGNEVVFINKDSLSVHTINLNDYGFDFENSKKGWAKIRSCVEYKNKILFPAWGLDSTFCVDKETWNVQKIDSGYVEDEIWKATFCRLFVNNGYVVQSDENDLKKFIKYEEFLKQQSEIEKESVGRRISENILH